MAQVDLKKKLWQIKIHVVYSNAENKTEICQTKEILELINVIFFYNQWA